MTNIHFVTAPEKAMIQSFADYGPPYPSVLTSYVYYKMFAKMKDQLYYRDWVLDSGAYTAHTTGKKIDLQEYINFCIELKATDPTLSEIYSLDVVSDWKASLVNCEKMWDQGVEAVPVYHMGEPAHVLKTMCATYPKVGIGGIVLMISTQKKRRFIDSVFDIAWPKKLHGLGLTTESLVKDYPWHSVDSSTWCLQPCAFGLWPGYGKISMSLKNNAKRNLRSQLDYFMKWETHNKGVWKKELSMLEDL